MTDVSGRAWTRIAALAIAGMLAAAGLWLAVGAGARDGTSARSAAYPDLPTYYDIKLDKTPPKVQYAKRQQSNVRAKFKFHIKAAPGYESQIKYLATKCKLDDGHYKKCDSPKTYKHLNKGKHKFRAKAYWKYTGDDASDPAKYAWKVK